MNVNRAFWPAMTSEARYLVLYGGAGSGKSWAAAQKLIGRCCSGPERFLVLRKVAKTLRHSTYQLLLDVLESEGLRGEAKVRKSDMFFEFPSTGATITHAGLDDTEKLKSIANITGTWIEEASELTEKEFDQVDLRLRGEVPSYRQHLLTFNPISTLLWLKRRFWDDPPADALVVHTTYEHNVFLDQDYLDVLLGMADSAIHQVYTLGEWGDVVKGLVYTGWRTLDAWPEVDDTCLGLDFGYNNPTALVRLGLRDQTNLYVDELLYARHLTNSDLIQEMDALEIDRSTPIVADSAEPQRIKEIELAGYNIFPADKDVLKGIDSVKRRSMNVTSSSSNILAELRSYKWQEDREGNVLDRPLKWMDHAMDAVRYAVHTRWGLPTPTEILQAKVAL